MAAFHPGLDELPAEFAIFPLAEALLLPRGKLPLNIFERRYLAMVLDSLGAGRMFGMIQPDPNADAVNGEPGVYRVEARLEAHGRERTWILSNPIHIR